MNLAKLCGPGSEAKHETYDYPVMTLHPHVETPLEQPRVADLVCPLLILLRASSSSATRELVYADQPGI